MRLFIAIDCNKRRDHFLGLQDELKERFAPEQLSPTDSFHLTLKFLGDVPRDRLAYIKRSLSRVDLHPFCITLDHLGFFSQKSGKGVVWAGLRSWRTISMLHRQIDRQLKPLFPDQPRFVPHVTLARIHQDQAAGKHLQAYAQQTRPTRLDVREFSLVQSVPERGRRAHVKLFTVPLTGKDVQGARQAKHNLYKQT